jgi:proteasome lid subunit RPN8/RPN11
VTSLTSLTPLVAKERPIGFYHTGPRLRSSDLEISDLFKRFCDRPVMVIVDTRASGGRGETGIPTDAYFAIEEIREVREVQQSQHGRGRLSAVDGGCGGGLGEEGTVARP